MKSARRSSRLARGGGSTARTRRCARPVKASPSRCLRRQRPAHRPSRHDRSQLEYQACSTERKCEQERLSLSMLRNEQRFLDILNQANAGNTSLLSRSIPAVSSSLTRTSCRSPLPARGSRPVDLVEDSRAAESAQRLAADDGRGHRRPRGRAGRRSLRRHAAHRRRSELVLSARLLLHSRSRRKISSPHGAREASWRAACARGPDTSRRLAATRRRRKRRPQRSRRQNQSMRARRR